jgi:hypothetical protein
MTRPRKPVTEPQAITVSSDVVIYTSIDGNGIHHTECNLCQRDIKRTNTANPTFFWQHCNCCTTKKPKEKFIQYQPASDTTATSTSVIHNYRKPCPGYSVQWKVGSIWVTYPYHQHATRELPWYPSAYDPISNAIIMHSVKCYNEIPLTLKTTICPSCNIIPHSPKFLDLKERAESLSLSPFFSTWYLTYQQQESYIRNLKKKSTDYRSKVCF